MIRKHFTIHQMIRRRSLMAPIASLQRSLTWWTRTTGSFYEPVDLSWTAETLQYALLLITLQAFNVNTRRDKECVKLFWNWYGFKSLTKVLHNDKIWTYILLKVMTWPQCFKLLIAIFLEKALDKCSDTYVDMCWWWWPYPSFDDFSGCDGRCPVVSSLCSQVGSGNCGQGPHQAASQSQVWRFSNFGPWTVITCRLNTNIAVI